MKVALGFGHWAISRWEAIVSLAVTQAKHFTIEFLTPNAQYPIVKKKSPSQP